MHRVEIEFIKGNDNWRERRIFESAIVDFKPGEYVHIKSQTEMFYCNLKEARLAWFSIEPVNVDAVVNSNLDNELIKIMRPTSNYSHFIDAIKRYREVTGEGLKESKDYCDKLRDAHKRQTELDTPF